MKKLFAILLAVTMLASMATVVSAANTTTLTTTVPAATYTLNIPADQEIPFGATESKIGELSVTNASGFAVGKNLAVTLNYDAFKCETTSTTIPFNVILCYTNTNFGTSIASGSSVMFLGQSNGATKKYVRKDVVGGLPEDLDLFFITMDSQDWGKALAGDYTATITFTAEVVAE